MMYASGSRAARRLTSSAKRARTASSIMPTSASSVARDTPAVLASRISASRRGLGPPAAASIATAASSIERGDSAPPSSAPAFIASSGAQRLGLLFGRERVDQRIERAVEHLVELMEREIDAMVGDARLRKVVGADALGAVARADHRTPRLGDLRLLLRTRIVQQPRAQNLERARLVLVLRFLVAAHD